MVRPFKRTLSTGIQIVKMGVVIFAPIFLLVSPATFFDQGQSISLFALLGVENYYSEGLTRACMHLIHFDFQVAMEYNRLAFIVVPLLVLLWGSTFWQTTKRLQKHLKWVSGSKQKNNEHEQAEFQNTP